MPLPQEKAEKDVSFASVVYPNTLTQDERTLLVLNKCIIFMRALKAIICLFIVLSL